MGWLAHSFALRWALTLISGCFAALAIHAVRTYPWHRIYLSRTTASPLQNVPASKLTPAISGTAPSGPCFVPQKTAYTLSGSEYSSPIGSFQEIMWNSSQCLKYQDRFAPYLDDTWNNSYIQTAQERLGYKDITLFPTVWSANLIWYANLLTEHMPEQLKAINWSDTTLKQACSSSHKSPATADTAIIAKKPQLAIVLRCYQGFDWTLDALLHLRAMIWELHSASALLSFVVDVDLLLAVRDAASHVSMFTEAGRRHILRGNVPFEFWPLVTLWSESEMTLRYPLYGDFRQGISAAGSYRGCLLPLQRFAVDHPEYDAFLNWEMDTRFTHTYDQLIESIYKYSYQAEAQKYTEWPVNLKEHGQTNAGKTPGEGICKNKNADVVVFSPVRDPVHSDWYWDYDVQGFQAMDRIPRAASVGTNLWLSRRALLAMENVTAVQHKSVFCEAMAPSIALQWAPSMDPIGSADSEKQCRERLKMVHFPHPVAFKYEASAATIDRLVNPSASVLSKRNEEALKDTSWYYASTIADSIYEQWRSSSDSCILPFLLHPVKGRKASTLWGRGKAWTKGWLHGSVPPRLCSSASTNCATILKADIERFTGRSFNSDTSQSLHHWDLDAPRYVSKRKWIMNSSTRDLVFTLTICTIVAVFGQILAGYLRRERGENSGVYIALSTDEERQS